MVVNFSECTEMKTFSVSVFIGGICISSFVVPKSESGAAVAQDLANLFGQIHQMILDEKAKV